MPNREKFVAKCAEHDVKIAGPVAYLEHRREEHEGVDFTLVWVESDRGPGGGSGGESSRTTGGVLSRLRRAWRRAGGSDL